MARWRALMARSPRFRPGWQWHQQWREALSPQRQRHQQSQSSAERLFVATTGLFRAHRSSAAPRPGRGIGQARCAVTLDGRAPRAIDLLVVPLPVVAINRRAAAGQKRQKQDRLCHRVPLLAKASESAPMLDGFAGLPARLGRHLVGVEDALAVQSFARLHGCLSGQDEPVCLCATVAIR